MHELKPTCAIKVWDSVRYANRRCDRPAKGTLANGSTACGIHLRQEAEAKRKDDAMDARLARQRDLVQRLRSLGGELAVEGVTSTLGASVHGLIIGPDDAEKLIERLRGEH